MKRIGCFLILCLPLISLSQEKFEIREFSGKIISFVPGFSFAYQRILVDVNGTKEGFSFYPNYGKLILEKFKIGDNITFKAKVNIRVRERLVEIRTTKNTDWFLFLDEVLKIKIGNEWISLDNGDLGKMERSSPKVFLEKEVKDIFLHDNHQVGLKLENGLIAYTEYFSFTFDKTPLVKKGDLVSFNGFKHSYAEGFVYPMEGVKEVYRASPLKKENGILHSFLFKQNFVCIGVKFKTNSGKELKLSFPSFRAIEAKAFLKPDVPLAIYYNAFETGRQNDLPELHAVIQNRDTLFINEMGFFGGADGQHDYVDMEVKGKITKLIRTAKGNIASIIIDSKYFIEVDAMMAQQLGMQLEKGKEIIVGGKERVKIVGEIYSKDYHIITPEKINIDGKTFSLYQP